MEISSEGLTLLLSKKQAHQVPPREEKHRKTPDSDNRPKPISGLLFRSCRAYCVNRGLLLVLLGKVDAGKRIERFGVEALSRKKHENFTK